VAPTISPVHPEPGREHQPTPALSARPPRTVPPSAENRGLPEGEPNDPGNLLSERASNENRGLPEVKPAVPTGLQRAAGDDSRGMAAGAATWSEAEVEEAARIADEVVNMEQQLEWEGEQQLAEPVAAASAGGKGSRRAGNAPARTRGTSSSSRAVGSQASAGSQGSGRSRLPIPRRLDPHLCDKIGISSDERDFIEFELRTWPERNYANRNIRQPLRGLVSHQETQQRTLQRYREAVAEEPLAVEWAPSGKTGRTGPKRSDIQMRPHSGAVAELKPWGYLLPSGTLVTTRAAVASGVATLQIQGYEIVGREQKRLVVVITANGNVFTPNPDTDAGWINLVSPDG
jgi:hypothetical protein